MSGQPVLLGLSARRQPSVVAMNLTEVLDSMLATNPDPEVIVLDGPQLKVLVETTHPD
jgi:hypothetical protein